MAHRKRILAGPLVVLAILAAGAAAPQTDADKAREVFESLYGADLKRVQATRDPADDAALAAKLVAAANLATGQPEFLILLCDTAYDLATGHPDGYAMAAAAMELEAANVPAKADACAEKMMAVRQRQYDAARGNDRMAAGEALIAALMARADAKVEACEFTDAAALFRRAISVARAIKSKRGDEAEDRARALVRSQRLAQSIDALKKRLEQDPSDAAAREQLVLLYLVDCDKPAVAARYVSDGSSEALRKYVPAAARPMEEAPELACREIAEWYRALAGGAAFEARPAMLVRAKGYYERFLSLHTAEDLDRTAAMLALGKVDEALGKLGGPPALRRVQFLDKVSMTPFKTGKQCNPFPAQETDDPAGPFAKKGVFFDNKSVKDVVYAVTWPGRMKELYYKGGAIFNMTVEVQDLKGKTLATFGPFGGGNKWFEQTWPMPPNVGPRFLLKFHNGAGVWFYIDTIEFR